MSTSPTAPEDPFPVKTWLWWFLSVAVMAAIVGLALFSWIDSRKVPVITFAATPRTQVAVDIRGAVSTPGVVFVDPGDRLIDVVNEAGGLSPNADLALINLSSRVWDGQMIVLPTIPPAGTDHSSSSQVNINTATVQELTQLPGIGDVLAGRIVAYREENGPFQSVDELVNVDGISDTKLEELRPFIRVTNGD